MHTAYVCDVVRVWFWKDIFPLPPRRSHASSTIFDVIEDEYTLFTINELINGTPASGLTPGFTGLIPLIEAYLNAVNIDVEARCELSNYLRLIMRWSW